MKRSLPVSIVLTIVTCGIYGIYWFITLTDEVNYLAKQEDTSGGMAFVFTLITCGIYGIYWAYRMGQKVSVLKEQRTDRGSDDSLVYLILSIFGLSIIVYALVQNEINNQLDYISRISGDDSIGNLSN